MPTHLGTGCLRAPLQCKDESSKYNQLENTELQYIIDVSAQSTHSDYNLLWYLTRYNKIRWDLIRSSKISQDLLRSHNIYKKSQKGLLRYHIIYWDLDPYPWSSSLILNNEDDSDGTGTGTTNPILALVLTVLSRVSKVMSTDGKSYGTNNIFIETES